MTRRGGGRSITGTESATSLLTRTALDPERPIMLGRTSLPSLETGQRVAGRYVVEALLGRGGFGEVYEVRDDARGGARVAMKLHRVDVVGEHVAAAIKAEFALLSTLRHPNLAQVHDFGYLEHEIAYFTQPIVSGVALDQLGLELHSPRAIRLIAQLCRALEYLHARGILHRDVKPSNVLVDPETDRVTLLDFGVSRPTTDPDRMALAGTHAYLAPEVITGGTIDARSDLYSLGVALYRVATGHLPFQGSASEILAAHVLERPPPLPDDLVAPGVAAVVHRLLAKDPEQRYASAADVLEALVAATGVRVETETRDTLASWVLSAEFVSERDWVGELVARAASVQGTVGPLLVTGEAGTGKSRLLREVRGHVQVAGESWIEVEASPREEARGLVQNIARAVLSRHVVRQLPDDDRIELARALPELRRRGERIAVAMDPDRARWARIAALARAMRIRFAREAAVAPQPGQTWAPEPIVARGGILAIEDLHWASADALGTLRQLVAAMRVERVPCLVIATSRPSPAAEAMIELGGVERVPIDALSVEQSARLVESIFGEPGVLAGTELGRALASGPHTGLWVHESLRLAIDRGAIARRGQSWVVTRAVPALSLQEVLAERVGLLSERSRAAALALAVLGEPAMRAEIGATAALGGHAVAAAMDDLVRSGIVEARRDRAGRVRYAMHARFAAPVQARFAPAAIRAFHARAGALLARGAKEDRDLLDRAAGHHAQAGDAETAVATWRRAAEIADRAGRPDLGVRLIERIASVRPLATRDWLLAHDYAVRAGMGHEAAATLERLVRLGARASREEKLEISLRRAEDALVRSDARAAVAIVRAALQAARRARNQRLVARLLLVDAEAIRQRGELPEAHRLFGRAAALAARTKNREVEARAWMGASLSALYIGKHRLAFDHARRSVRAAKAAADRTLESEALRTLGNVARDRSETSISIRSYRAAVRIARESGSTAAEAKALNNIGIMSQFSGHLGESAEAFRRAVVLKERLGAASSLAVTHNNLGALLIGMGRLDEARLYLEKARAALVDESLTVSSVAEGNHADLLALEGRLDEAITGFRSSLEKALQRGVVEQQPHAATGLARALLMRGRREDVRESEQVVDVLASVAGENDPETLRRWWTTRAMQAWMRGDLPAMLDDARRAARLGDVVRHQAGAFATPLETWWICALAAHRTGLMDEAARMRERALRLLSRVARLLPSPSERTALYDGHPIHRAVVQAAWDAPTAWTWIP